MSMLRKNFSYNPVLTVLYVIFPLISFPYVTSVLGPIGVGKVTFAVSVVDYFRLFASLGIPLYAVHTVAQA